MEEDELATTKREGREIGGGGLDEWIGGMERELVYVDFRGAGVGAEDAAWPHGQQS